MSLKTAASVSKSLALIGTAAVSMGAAVEGAFAAMVVKSESVVFAYNKMSQQAGISLDSFSKLAYAAKIAGVPVETLGVILTRVGRSAFMAGSGNKQLSDMYKALGVAVVDSNGHFRDSGAVFQDLSVALSNAKDSTAKLGYEQMLMGRSGSQVASMMKLISSSGTELGKMAEKLGVVFTPDQAKGAITLHNAITNLEQAGLGLSVKLSTAVVPALDKAASKLLELASNGDTLKRVQEVAASLATGLTLLANVFVFLVDHASAIKTVLEALVAVRAVVFFSALGSSMTGTAGIVEKLAVGIGNLGGRFLGLPKLGLAFVGLTKNATEYAAITATCAKEDGVLTTASVALKGALNGVALAFARLAASVAPLAAIALGIYAVGSAITSVYQLNKEIESDGKNWADIWADSAKRLEDRALSLKTVLLNLIPGLGTLLSFRDAMDDKKSEMFMQNHTAPKAPGVPDGYNFATGKIDGEGSGTNLPPLPIAPKEDKIAKRLEELRLKAKEAADALALVGKDPQQLRNAEIAEQYGKFLADNDTKVKHLTDSQKKLVLSYITTEINDKGLTDYGDALLKQTSITDMATRAQVAMTDALSATAAASRDAAIAAQVESEFNKGGNDPNWRTNHKDDVAARTEQLKQEADAKTDARNQVSIIGLGRQQVAQENLNKAIMQGSEATEKAQLVNLEASIRDTERDANNTDDTAIQMKVDGAKLLFQQNKDAEDFRKAAAASAQMVFADQKKNIEDIAAAAAKSGHALDYSVILEMNKANLATFNESMDKATLATGTAMQGLQVYFRQMGRDVESGAQQMHTVLTGVFTSLNDTLSELMINQKNNFASFFRGIADQLAHMGLQKFEVGVIQSLGNRFGTKDKDPNNPGGVKKDSGGPLGKAFDAVAGIFGGKGAKAAKGDSAATPLYVSVVNQGMGLPAIPGLPSASNESGAGKGILGSLLGLIPGVGGIASDLHLPGFAMGGDIQAGVPIKVGEMGSETFVPNQNGSIVPHNKMNSGTVYDFRGADFTGTNAAETQAKIQAAMIQTHSQSVKDSVAVRHDQNRRSPSSRRQ